MTAIRAIKSEFSTVNGSKVRIVRDIRGSILGTITKTEDGYRVTRVDGKVRVKPKLEQAFKSIVRAN